MAAKKKMTMDQFMELVVGEFASMRGEMADMRTEFRSETASLRAEMKAMRVDINQLQKDTRFLLEEWVKMREEQIAQGQRLSDVALQISHIEDNIDDHKGFAKEIDYTMARVTRIETHLGLPAFAY